jgi:hypothetical protein
MKNGTIGRARKARARERYQNRIVLNHAPSGWDSPDLSTAINILRLKTSVAVQKSASFLRRVRDADF